MEIRLAHTEDTKEMAQVAKIIWEETYTPINGPESVAYMLKKFQSEFVMADQIKSGTYIYWVAVDAGKIVGYLAYQNRADDTFLSKVYLLSEERGHGIAAHLLEKVPTNKPITLTVNKHNLVAKARYEKWGFEVIDAVVNEIGEGFVMDDFVMQKK